MAETTAGRHRASGKFTPVNEISTLLAESAGPAVKTSAVLAAAGGLVAAFAVPAQAATEAAAPVAETQAAAPVVVESKASPAAPAAFGLAGFTAKAKPKPKPVVVVADREDDSQASRSESRESTSSSSSSSSSEQKASNYPMNPVGGDVVSIAKQYIGLMYRYGGTSPSTGFDCSGFTSFVFRKAGISLPRTAEAQRQATHRVSDPQPGDLVFFGGPAYHVGIYVGNGMMIDSPRSGKAVDIRSIWSSSVTYGRP